MITDFISSTSDVRALLGVSAQDLADEVIQSAVFEITLKTALRSGSVDLLAMHTAILAKPENSRTTGEKNFIDAVHVYAAYSLAQMLLPSLPQLAYKSETDSKAGYVRQDVNFADIAEGIARGLANAVENLGKAAAALNAPVTITTVYFSGLAISSPTANPVTG